jgi:UDP:flavonoid glycosyltransferase YjiC (YdhE family)
LPEVSGAVFRSERGWLTPDYFRDNLTAEQTILGEIAPDVVVFDFRFTTSLSAHLAGLPSVSILHGNALRLALRPRETAQLLIGDAQALSGIAALRVRFLQWLFPLFFQFIMRLAVGRLVPLLKAHGGPTVNSPFGLMMGDELLVADLPDLLPPELPAHSHVIGPLTWSGWEQPAPWLDEFDDRPIVYVTMGSTVEAQEILLKIIDALRDGHYNSVVSRGSILLPADLELPDCIRVFSTVPGASVVRRSAAVVHHGGHETLMQAVAGGVPSLILPANPDQILIAQQAHALGIGHNLRRPGRLPVGARWLRQITPAEIRSAVDDLIADQRYAMACRTLTATVDFRGASLAAEILEETARPASSTPPAPALLSR